MPHEPLTDRDRIAKLEDRADATDGLIASIDKSLKAIVARFDKAEKKLIALGVLLVAGSANGGKLATLAAQFLQ